MRSRPALVLAVAMARSLSLAGLKVAEATASASEREYLRPQAEGNGSKKLARGKEGKAHTREGPMRRAGRELDSLR